MINVSDNCLELELKNKTFSIKGVPYSKYNDLVKIFDELLEFQIKVEFSIAHIIADKKCLDRINKILKMLRTEDSDVILTIDTFEDNLNDLCELLFGMTKDPKISLQEAFWSWAYPNNNRTLSYLEKFDTMPQDEILKQLLQETRTPDLKDVFSPPYIAILHHLNWFTDFLNLAKKINEEMLREAQKLALPETVEQNTKSILTA